MAGSLKIDSNIVGLRIAEELPDCPGDLPVTPEWLPYEPNSYDEFGSDVRTKPRNTINADRSVLKGSVVGEDAVAGFQMDFTTESVFPLMQGFMFADWILKAEEASNGTNATSFLLVSTTGFAVGDLVFTEKYLNAVNNVFDEIASVVVDTSVDLVTLAAPIVEPPLATARMTKVGRHFAAGDVSLDFTGGITTLTSAADDFTLLELLPGEWFHLGGDNPLDNFLGATNIGWCRVGSVAPTVTTIICDKGPGIGVPVTEGGGVQEIRMYVGHTIKNELGASGLQKTRTYQSERSLGAGNGFEYVAGIVANTLNIQMPEEDLVTLGMGFVGLRSEEQLAQKAGNRPAPIVEQVFNTSSDVGRLRLLNDTQSQLLFQNLTGLSVSINNNAKILKAVGFLGGFDINVGDFMVEVTADAYFTSIGAIQAIRDNDDISLDFILAKSNAAWLFDIPLMTLGAGRKAIEKDEPIKLPITSTGNRSLVGHTLIVQNFNFIPTVAE